MNLICSFYNRIKKNKGILCIYNLSPKTVSIQKLLDFSIIFPSKQSVLTPGGPAKHTTPIRIFFMCTLPQIQIIYTKQNLLLFPEFQGHTMQWAPSSSSVDPPLSVTQKISIKHITIGLLHCFHIVISPVHFIFSNFLQFLIFFLLIGNRLMYKSFFDRVFILYIS